MDGGTLPPDALEALTRMIWAGHAEVRCRAEPDPAREPAGAAPPGGTATHYRDDDVAEDDAKVHCGASARRGGGERSPTSRSRSGEGEEGGGEAEPEQQEARPLGSGPPPLNPATLPKFKGGPPGPGPQPVSPPKPGPEKKQRPGWVE